MKMTTTRLRRIIREALEIHMENDKAAPFGSGMEQADLCLLYTSPSPRDLSTSRMPSSA